MTASLRTLLRVPYGLYVWALFVLLSFTTLILVLVVPPLTVRRAIARQIAGLFLLLAGMPVRVLSAHRLPGHPCVVVANHSSYLDGVILKAALPAHFSFVIKKEMVRVPLAGALLRRIGSEFVDRFNRHSGGMDARRIIRTASAGQSLAFFPEGTFTEQRGLARFHIGAFVIAVRASMPVVPIAIRGARRALPASSIWPHPGRIEVEVLSVLPLETAPDSSAAAARFRDAARDQILAAVGEPDLDQETAAPSPPRPD
jgi:1-acyl-sn-glycerol-3-phosphate acyltransferase